LLYSINSFFFSASLTMEWVPRITWCVSNSLTLKYFKLLQWTVKVQAIISNVSKDNIFLLDKNGWVNLSL